MTDNTVVQFRRENLRQTPVVPQESGTKRRDIADVLLSAAYHFNQGNQQSARALLSYVMAHNPVPAGFDLPSDLQNLVDQTDFGEAMFPG